MATKRKKSPKLTMTQVRISELQVRISGLNDRITAACYLFAGKDQVTVIDTELRKLWNMHAHQIKALEEAICPRVAARLTALERASVKDGWVGSVDGRSNFNLREFVKHVQEANTRLTALEKAMQTVASLAVRAKAAEPAEPIPPSPDMRKLREDYDELYAAAALVVESWCGGDLAAAVNALGNLL